MNWPWTRKPVADIRTSVGERGRWRWFAYNELGHPYRLAGPPYGFDTEPAAKQAAKRLFGVSWKFRFR